LKRLELTLINNMSENRKKLKQRLFFRIKFFGWVFVINILCLDILMPFN